ncbi:MAG TPA: OmpH family outer membrane protein [Chitinophaga sp.]|uniref:OmpH family outer membrane protein n=1 Tax=Chitinophaga sp. TaxID=1869181 RepID=UPI002F927A86
MRKNCTFFLFLCFFITFTTTHITAQSKIAYIDLQQLVSGMPEAKQAYDTLRIYEQGIVKTVQGLMTDFQAKVDAYEKQSASLNPDIREIKEKELLTAKNNIEEYKMRMEQKLAARQQELITPILTKAKKAVSDLATEKGYACVLDSSKDILVAANCDDLLIPAKQKLGIK